MMCQTSLPLLDVDSVLHGDIEVVSRIEDWRQSVVEFRTKVREAEHMSSTLERSNGNVETSIGHIGTRRDW